MSVDWLRWAWMRLSGEIAYRIIRPFPLPIFSPGTLRWRVSTRLWGMAYVAGELPTYADWCEFHQAAREHAA